MSPEKPWVSTRCRKTPSAVGERQMLPVQTKRTLTKLPSSLASQTMIISSDQHIVILTGAGISKESGLDTFRDAGSSWSQVRI